MFDGSINEYIISCQFTFPLILDSIMNFVLSSAMFMVLFLKDISALLDLNILHILVILSLCQIFKKWWFLFVSRIFHISIFWPYILKGILNMINLCKVWVFFLLIIYLCNINKNLNAEIDSLELTSRKAGTKHPYNRNTY